MPNFLLALLLTLFIGSGLLCAEESDEEASYISRIQSLEASYSQNVQDKTLENELAKTYLEYSSYLAGKKRTAEAREFLDMAQGLGAQSAEVEALQQKIGAAEQGESSPNGFAEKLKETFEGSANVGKEPTEEFLLRKNMAVTLFKEGIEAFKEKNYELSEDRMKRVLEYDPGSKYAHELLGDICYFTQRLDEARIHWERSMTSENMARVKKKLIKVREEIPIEKKLQPEEEEHFLIRYAKTNREFSSYEIKSFLREAYREVYQDFGVPLSGKTIVLLYDRDVFEMSVRPSHWSGAIYDGKIRVPLPASGAEATDPARKDLKKLIFHELTHVFIHEIGGKKVPLWLHEGLAQYEENKVTPIPAHDFYKALYKGEVIRMTDLIHKESFAGDDSSVRLFYQQSYLFAQFLVKRYGFYKIREILKAIKGGESFDSAALLFLNASPEELERRWRSTLKKI